MSNITGPEGITLESDKSPFAKDIVTYTVPSKLIDELYKKGTIKIPQKMTLYPNQGVILKNNQQSALGLTDRHADTIIKVDENIEYFGIRGRNKEQSILTQILSDEDIRCIAVTGPAGTGKTLVAGAWAFEQITNDFESYESLILTKPMEIVGNSKYFGTVPGGENDKFKPFIASFRIMFENLLSENGKSYIDAMIQNGKIEYFPLELMRGASLQNCILFADESQSLNNYELGSLGSRLDDVGHSKLIVSGDLNQRDRNIVKQRTGLWKLITSSHFQKSKHTAHIHLKKIERGEIAQLFVDIFDDED